MRSCIFWRCICGHPGLRNVKSSIGGSKCSIAVFSVSSEQQPVRLQCRFQPAIVTSVGRIGRCMRLLENRFLCSDNNKNEWRRYVSRTKSGGHCQVTYDVGDRKVERAPDVDGFPYRKPPVRSKSVGKRYGTRGGSHGIRLVLSKRFCRDSKHRRCTKSEIRILIPSQDPKSSYFRNQGCFRGALRSSQPGYLPHARQATTSRDPVVTAERTTSRGVEVPPNSMYSFYWHHGVSPWRR